MAENIHEALEDQSINQSINRAIDRPTDSPPDIFTRKESHRLYHHEIINPLQKKKNGK